MRGLGLVLQAGGNGTRFMETDIPKPIYPLSDEGETCLSNILGSVRYGTPVFLHIQPGQKAKYMEHIMRINSRGEIFYLIQDDGFVYNTKGEAVLEAGKPLRFKNGPGSFRRNLREIVENCKRSVEFFAVYDACKTGICFDDAVNGAKRLEAEGKGVLCCTRKLTDEEIEHERASKCRSRWDFALNGGVYDKKHMPFNISTNPDARALTGLNIFRYERFIANTADLRGLTDYYPGKHPEILYAYDFRITDVINSFRIEDRIFAIQEAGHCFPSIKTPEDLDKYGKFKARRETK